MWWMQGNLGGGTMGTYDIAQICLNGHVLTTTVNTSPERTAKHCKKCGEATITACPSCNAAIRGFYHIQNVVRMRASYSVPSFCHNCGKPYPWTERKLQAAEELINELEEISDVEKKKAIDSLPDLMTETPGTELAVSRFKRLYDKVPLSLKETFRKLVVDISAEAIKKSMTGM